MDQNIPTPDFLDIGEDVQRAAQAALNSNSTLTPPDDARVSTAKNGDVYKRWVEGVTIDKTWREATKSGLVSAVVQMTVRVGYPNAGKKVWARHVLNLGLLSGAVSEEQAGRGHVFMNTNSINAISSLLAATGYQPTTGGLTGRLLNLVFPVKEQPGAESPLKGKAVIVNLVDSPNKGEQARTPTRTQVESYLPDVK